MPHRPPSLLSRTAALWLACSLAALCSASLLQHPPDPDTPQAPPDPARVVIRVNRYADFAGYVQLEDDHVLVVQALDGEVQSFVKSRVLQIVRLVDPQPGQHGTVVLRNGQTRAGIIIRDDFKNVIIEIEGVRTTFKRDIVDHVRLEPTFEQLYKDFKRSLKPEMADRHLALCRWLIRQRRYALAQQELLELLDNHESPEAMRLLNIVQAQIALQQSPKPDLSPQQPPDPAGALPAQPYPGGLLSDEDVNIIRVFEIDFRRPPKVAIRKETITRLIETYGRHERFPASGDARNALYRAEPLEIVQLMFTLRARDLYPEIMVLSEPYAMNLFRQRVHNTWLLNNCATSRCHGGAGSRFRLHRRQYKRQPVRYTNFLILERLQLDPDHRLIDYEDPLNSLILQYGLPRDRARFPHPPVRGWKPAFRSPDDRLFRDTLRWIDAMFRPRPDYPVDYQPPMIDPHQPSSDEPDPPDTDRTER